MSIDQIIDFLNYKLIEDNAATTAVDESLTILDVLIAVLIIIIGFIIVKIVGKYIKKAMLRAEMSKILAEFTSRVIKILLIIFFIATGIGFLGVNMGEAVLGFSVVSGFVIGFAFQQTLGNIAAGFMIAITKPFRVGDYVDIAGKSGTVDGVGASITSLTTVDNKEVIIPNSKIWGEAIVNYTANNKRMIDMRVGISYNDDMDKAIKLTLDVLKKNKKVVDKPAPYVAVANLSDSSVDLLIRPWVETSNYWDTKWELTQQIKETFDKNKISIPFPQRDIHLFEQKNRQ
jgi:small conductance mechanosensitive channel